MQNSYTQSQAQIPAINEIEVTIFGDGFGESILIHAGNGVWFCIDSCKSKQKPAVLQYLHEIGVSPSAIKTVYATHWDTDHISGISEVLKASENADFVISAALEDDTFHGLVLASPLSQLHDSYKRANSFVPNAISEFLECYRELINIKKKGLRYAFRDQRQEKVVVGSDVIEILALSPHDSCFQNAVQAIISCIPDGNYPVGDIAPPKPNLSSVVLCLRTPHFSVLFGADMEEQANHRGWSLILDDSSYKGEISGSVFKVAHHGSDNGHHDRIYSEILLSSPICVIAPYNKGMKLPRKSDIERVLSFTSELYLTSPTYIKPKKGNNKHIERAYNRRKVTNLNGPSGYVRLQQTPHHGMDALSYARQLGA